MQCHQPGILSKNRFDMRYASDSNDVRARSNPGPLNAETTLSAQAAFTTSLRFLTATDSTGAGDPITWAEQFQVDVSGNVTASGTYNGVTITAHNARHERGGADEIDGDHLDIDWNPSRSRK